MMVHLQVIYNIVDEDFEISYEFILEQERNSPVFEFELVFQAFGRNQLRRSILALFQPFLTLSAERTFKALSQQIAKEN